MVKRFTPRATAFSRRIGDCLSRSLHHLAVIFIAALLEATLEFLDALYGTAVGARATLGAAAIALSDEGSGLLPLTRGIRTFAPTAGELRLDFGELTVCEVRVVARDVTENVSATDIFVAPVSNGGVRGLVMRAKLLFVLGAELLRCFG